MSRESSSSPDAAVISAGRSWVVYSAMMAMGLGWACFWSGGIALVLAAVFIVFLHAKAKFEELLLNARFEDYPSYADRVPRYLPSWRAASRGRL